ncbi:MAG: UDP-glucose/GDP-mannose dehydrogenase family protein [Terriglobales bacterium]
MRVSIFGCGYVGLVTGACLAEIGHEVLCSDNDAAKVQTLQTGKLPIYEPGLDRVVEANVAAGRLRFSSDLEDAAKSGDVLFVCVGTPPLPNGEADLSAVDNVARLIAKVARTPKLVVEKSTVPIQTGQQVKRALAVYGRQHEKLFRVASNPEFLREGTAVTDFLHPDRIVVGVDDHESEQILRDMYRPIVERNFHCRVHSNNCGVRPAPRFLVTTINSAELIKHASNSFLALKISYANLIADVCEQMGADIAQVTQAMGMDPRIGSAFLNAGLGFGGFCLPKDVQAFIHLGETAGVDMAMLRSAEEINKSRVVKYTNRLRKLLWVLKGKHVGVLGLAFKPYTDDIRFAPAIDLIKALESEGVRVKAYDPEALERAASVLPGVALCRSADEVAEGVDALVVATEWPEFKELDWQKLLERMSRPLVLDCRNLLDAETMTSLGYEYYCVGRPERGPEAPTSRAEAASRR